jgi:type IV secretory pathway VirB2 component (pilin)
MKWSVYLAVLTLTAPAAFAGTTTGLPWETPLTTIMNSLTGPVALAVSLIAITITGGVLVFGGDLGEFARRSILLVLVIGLIVAATSVLTTLFGTSGAVV